MDKFNIEANTGKIEISFDFSKLSGDKKVTKELSFCKTKNAQMQDSQRSRKSE